MANSAVPHLSPSDTRAPSSNDNEAAGWPIGSEWSYQGHIYKHVGGGVWIDLAGSGGGGGGPHALTHTAGGSDPITVTQAQVTGLEAALAAKADAGAPPTAHSHPWSEVTGRPQTFPADPHLHDDRYYTEAEVDALLAGVQQGGGASGKTVVLHHPHMAASAAATNLAANAFNAVSDPNFRQMVDLRGLTKVRIQGRIGGTLVAATRLRVQYHLGGNPAVATADAGWVTLAESAGSHTANAMFYSAEASVPVGAQVNHCLLRVGLLGGDGVADPTITACILNLYP